MPGRGPILNLAEAPVVTGGHGERFGYRISELARNLGAKAMGANVTTVSPGQAAFPYHHHFANEEHFFILSGHGTLRVGAEHYEVGPHDYIVNLAGDASHAHQLVNTGTEDLVYLAIATTILPEVVGYPDSQKTGVRAVAGTAPGLRFLVHDVDRTVVGYYDGEDGRNVTRILQGHASKK